jgi:hypothetical protein
MDSAFHMDKVFTVTSALYLPYSNLVFVPICGRDQFASNIGIRGGNQTLDSDLASHPAYCALALPTVSRMTAIQQSFLTPQG